MGTGVSRSVRVYMLNDWAPEVDAPDQLEKDARRLAREAVRQAEAHAPQHRQGLPSSSQPRPLWLDPTLLHVAVAGPTSAAADTVLAALSCVMPMAEVVPEEEGDCPFRDAAEIGLRCFAIVDPELRTLRIWSVTDPQELYGAGMGLTRFDLLLWAHTIAQDGEEEEATTIATNTAVSPTARQELEETILKLRAEKQRCIDCEDYDAAHEAREQEKMLQAELQSLSAVQEASGPSAEEQQRLEEQLRQARVVKQAAIDDEDYDAAFEAKQLEKKALAELEQLQSQPKPVRQQKGRGSRTDIVEAGKFRGCPLVLHKLASWPAGRPPVLVVAHESLVLEGTRRRLPEASVWELSSAALQGSSPEASTLLMRSPAFCDILEASLQIITKSRSFPSSTKEEDYGDGVKRGTHVRLCRLNSEAYKAHNGKGGIVVDKDQKGFHIRLWDDEVLEVFRTNFTHFKLALLPPSPCVLTRMDQMIIRLKDLKSKPQLNGQEGYTDSSAEESGRHNVRLKDGTTIAAKPANFDVIEHDRPELEGCIGLLDGFQIGDDVRYKVLVVKPGGQGRVRLQGLVKKPELNGKEGKITSFNMQTERHQVLLGDGSQIGVKRSNIHFLEPQRITARVLALRTDSVDYWLDPDEEERLFSR